MIGSHIDALCMKVKPHSKVDGKEEWERLGVAPYSVGGASQRWDASFSTWWDRDLGCGGRVLVRGDNGKVEQKLIRMPGAGEFKSSFPFSELT
jgi:aminopeptidase I